MHNRRFARLAWGTLAYTVAVVLWGAFVRATGSGAGCGDHWPLCNGELVPRAPSVQTLVEYSHRITSGLAMLLALGMVIWSRLAYPKQHRVRRGAFWVGVFMLLEAAIGAGLVLFELVAFNEEIARAYWMAAHLVNTFILLGAMTLTAHWASGGAAFRVRGHGGVGRALMVALAGMLVLAASGGVTALGDTLAIAGGISPEDSAVVATLVGLRLYHPMLAFAVFALVAVACYLAATERPSPLVLRLAKVVAFTFAGQIALGGLNVWLMAPVWIQLTHLLLSDLIWIGLVLLMANALASEPAAEVERRAIA